MFDPADRAQFLNLAGVFEGGLVFVALGLGWLVGVEPFDGFRLDADAALVGLLGAIPPFLLLMLAERLSIAPLVRIKTLVVEMLGPSLVACRWYDIILLSALAGVGEELLFRGLAQPWLEREWGWIAGLALSNAVFAMFHFITPTYALLAGLMGVYFGVLLDVTGSRSLLGPILAHGVYDYLAFLVVIRDYRSSVLQ